MNSYRENSDIQTRTRVIEMQLLRMGRKTSEMDISVALEDLEEIPTQRLEWCCKQARRKNENVSPPTNNMILKQHMHVGNGKGQSWENTVMESMKRRISQREIISKNNTIIEVASPGDDFSRKITPQEFIKEADDHVNNAV